MIGNSNDETNILNKSLLTNTQVSKIRKAFANGLSANIKFSKTQLSKMIKSGGLIGPPNLIGSTKIFDLPIVAAEKKKIINEIKNKSIKKCG